MAENEAGRPLLRFLSLTAAVLLGAFAQGLLRGSAAYLVPGSVPSLCLARSVSAASCALGALVARAIRAGEGSLSLGIFGLSCALSASGPIWFASFFSGQRAPALILLPLVAIALGIGFVAVASAQAFGSAARALHLLNDALEPWRALFALGLLLGSAALGAHLGLWRSGALVGLCSAILGVSLSPLSRYLRGPLATPAKPLLAAFALAGALISFALAGRFVPATELGRYPGELVFVSRGPGRYVVSSVQQGFEVFRRGVLYSATVDAKRYAESLVQPALALAKRRTRVLALGTGNGFVERELLSYPDVERVLSVTDDLSLSQLARENATFTGLASDALRSPRVTLIEAEALPFLTQHPATFDVIVVDLPDPSDFSQGKNYTHFFYQQLAQHLNPGGVFVTQATSNAATPATFASIVRTVESAGFSVRRYAAPIPTLGEWGFVIGSLSDSPPVYSAYTLSVLSRTTYVDRRTLDLLLATPPPSDKEAQTNTLSDQPVVELLNDERRARGL